MSLVWGRKGCGGFEEVLNKHQLSHFAQLRQHWDQCQPPNLMGQGCSWIYHPPPPVHVCRRYRMTEGLWGARGRVGTGPHPSPRAVPEVQESRSLLGGPH